MTGVWRHYGHVQTDAYRGPLLVDDGALLGADTGAGGVDGEVEGHGERELEGAGHVAGLGGGARGERAGDGVQGRLVGLVQPVYVCVGRALRVRVVAVIVELYSRAPSVIMHTHQ